MRIHLSGAPRYLQVVRRLEDAFTKAGVVFIAENGGAPGVRLRAPER
jgi:hypothetical protein